MSKQIIWLIILAVVVGLALAGYLWWPKEELVPQSPEQPKAQSGLINLQQAIEKTNTVAAPEVPSANPLQKVAPVKNPIEVTNPFSDGYQNPFK